MAVRHFSKEFPNLKESTVLIKYDKIKRIKLTATNIANGFEEDSTRECFLANGLNIEDSRMFSVAPISRYTVSSVHTVRALYVVIHIATKQNIFNKLWLASYLTSTGRTYVLIYPGIVLDSAMKQEEHHRLVE